MPTISELKEKSGAVAFASVLGKSTIDKNSLEYQTIEKAVEILLNNGYGIIHGGYAGGAMAAASDTANRVIQEKNLPKELNIGVPQKEHDGLWERVTDASFTEAAEDIYTRLKVVTSGDIAVVCPKGGDGTELEETIVFHENVVREGIKKYAPERNSSEPTPLIFLQTPTGTNWRKILEAKFTHLDTSIKEFSGYKWLYFIDTLEEFEKLIIELKHVFRR
jgi:hypothetical protein